jgi:DNA-binding MarR family transcriptional regulator
MSAGPGRTGNSPQTNKPESLSIILTHLHRDVSREFSKQAGMSFSRILVLHELLHAGELSQSELQQRLTMEGALVTRFVKEMEAGGLIVRRVDPRDNRFTLVSLAPAGRRTLKEMSVLREDFEARLLEGVSEEDRAVTARSMKRMLRNLSGSQD